MSQHISLPLAEVLREHNRVDARSLHTWLEVGKDFSTWIQERIEKYGFTEDEDFSPNLGKSVFGRPKKEYHLSIDMAKELCLLENNIKGRHIRREFIQLEKQAHQMAEQCMVLQDALKSHLPAIDKQIIRYKDLGLTNAEVAKLTGVLPATISKHLRKLESLNLIAPPANLAALQERAKHLVAPSHNPGGEYAHVQ